MEERLKEVMRLVEHYEEAIRRCDVNIARERNMTPGKYKDPVTVALKHAVGLGKFDSDDPERIRWKFVNPTEAKIKKRVRDNINHAIHNISQSSHRAALNFRLDEKWHQVYDRQCTMGIFIQSTDLVDKDSGQPIEFRNPEAGIENDVGTDDTFKPCRQRIGSRSARFNLSFESTLERPPWEQSDLAVRTLDGRYHEHGISRKGLHVLEREGRRVIRARCGTLQTERLKKNTVRMTMQERSPTRKRALSSNQAKEAVGQIPKNTGRARKSGSGSKPRPTVKVSRAGSSVGDSRGGHNRKTTRKERSDRKGSRRSDRERSRTSSSRQEERTEIDEPTSSGERREIGEGMFQVLGRTLQVW